MEAGHLLARLFGVDWLLNNSHRGVTCVARGVLKQLSGCLCVTLRPAHHCSFVLKRRHKRCLFWLPAQIRVLGDEGGKEAAEAQSETRRRLPQEDRGHHAHAGERAAFHTELVKVVAEAYQQEGDTSPLVLLPLYID